MTSKTEHPAYAAMLEQAESRKLPRSFKSDLTNHDRIALRGYDRSQVFAWFLYRHGTHVVTPGSNVLGRRAPKRTTRDDLALCWKHCADFGEHAAFVWDGATLRECCSLDELADRMLDASGAARS